ncbi:MAG: DUF362 domain-containing protein [Nitrospirae bacterium]|nr:DUF362 domain-containing protein [Nitrospirota bacterium]
MPTVTVEKYKEETLINQIEKACQTIGIAEDISNVSRSVFIKPNLTYPFYKKGVTTRVEFVRSLVDVLKKLNPKIKIYIGEGDGGYNSYSMTDAFKNMGFTTIMDEFSNVEIINLSKVPSRTVVINTLLGDYPVDLPEIFFTDIDFSISCPLPKVHCMTKLTLSYKNQWGCLPDTMRLKNHYMFDYLISKISEVLKFKYAFLDGKYGLDNNGPMVGHPVEINWFVASDSLGAFDMVVSEMMGFNWKKVRHLNIAEKYGFVPKRDSIHIVGDIESLKKNFYLKRTLWNYPALAAFQSKILTQFFYISKWSKLFHDLMYLIRKKPL